MSKSQDRTALLNGHHSLDCGECVVVLNARDWQDVIAAVTVALEHFGPFEDIATSDYSGPLHKGSPASAYLSIVPEKVAPQLAELAEWNP